MATSAAWMRILRRGTGCGHGHLLSAASVGWDCGQADVPQPDIVTRTVGLVSPFSPSLVGVLNTAR